MACKTADVSLSGIYMNTLQPPSISLQSVEGNRLFDEARAAGTATGTLTLLSHFQTQAEVTYCGLSSLVVILNALNIDPTIVWKGRWRWYNESMLADKETLERVKAGGISFQQLVDLVPKDKVKLEAFFASESSLLDFRQHIKNVTSTNTSFILVSYLRGLLNQTGAGHYSPIAAYNDASDVVLILDVARFKYPPHWVPVRMLWEAMTAINAITGKSRGFMVISKP